MEGREERRLERLRDESLRKPKFFNLYRLGIKVIFLNFKVIYTILVKGEDNNHTVLKLNTVLELNLLTSSIIQTLMSKNISYLFASI